MARESKNLPLSEDLRQVNPTLAAILERRLFEADRCRSENLLVPAVVMYGSILEGMLLAIKDAEQAGKAKSLISNSVADGKSSQLNLGDVLSYARSRNWLSDATSNTAEGLRAYRNWVHPIEESKSGVSLTAEHVDMVRAILFTSLTELKSAMAEILRQRRLLFDLPDRLLGRDLEVKFLRKSVLGQEWERSRLLTVVGQPGVGKTALVEAAMRLANEVAEVRLSIDLSSVQSEVELDAKEAFWSVSLGTNSKIRPLLLLHSCEHLIEELKPRLLRILRANRDLQIIATSTKHFDISTVERVFRLRGLKCSLNDTESEAVKLLLERIQARHYEWEPNAKQLGAASKICFQLDGNPLAISMIAPIIDIESDSLGHTEADVQSETDADQLRGLDKFLVSIFESSYKLLSQSEQSVLGVIASFNSVISVDLIRNCLNIDDYDEFDIVLKNLENSSWVTCKGDSVDTLATRRRFVRAKLGFQEVKHLKLKQALVFADRLESLNLTTSGDNSDALGFTEKYEKSIYEVVAWCISNNALSDDVFKCVVFLSSYWKRAGHARIAYQICKKACGNYQHLQTPPQFLALRELGCIARDIGHFNEAIEAHQFILGAAQEALDIKSQRLQDLGDDYWAVGDLVSARRCFEESLVSLHELASNQAIYLAFRGNEQIANIARLSDELEVAKHHLALARQELASHPKENLAIEWMRGWLALAEANWHIRSGLGSPDNIVIVWSLLFNSAKELAAQADDRGLAFVAERALQVSILIEDKEKVASFFHLAQVFRLLTDSEPPTVDKKEYLDSCFAAALTTYNCSRVDSVKSKSATLRFDLLRFLRSATADE